MKVAAILLCTLCAVLAEPPVPNSQYLPANNGPSPNYGAPSFGGNGGNGGGYPGGNGNGNGNGGRPNNQYGPPQKPNNQYGPPSTGYGAPNGGGKNGYGGDDEGEPASYQFEYMVKDDESGNDFGHMEQREGDVAQGKYYVLLPDGRKQIVEYTADTDGYHPKVSYEEGAGAGGYQNGGYPSNGKNGGNGGYPSGNGNGGGNGGYNY